MGVGDRRFFQSRAPARPPDASMVRHAFLRRGAFLVRYETRCIRARHPVWLYQSTHVLAPEAHRTREKPDPGAISFTAPIALPVNEALIVDDGTTGQTLETLVTYYIQG